VVIGINQSKHVLGIHVPSGLNYNINMALYVLQHIPSANVFSVSLGCFTLSLLILLPLLKSYYPTSHLMYIISSLSTLLAVILATVISFSPLLTDPQTGKSRVLVVGEVPSGLPSFSLPPLTTITVITTLFPACIPVTILGYMESYAISRKYSEYVVLLLVRVVVVVAEYCLESDNRPLSGFVYLVSSI